MTDIMHKASGPHQSAVVLVNLGTPQSPTASAVRRFLKQFLSDPRVVDLPRWVWWPLLYGIILPFRSPRVARLYQHIWWAEGSPLEVIAKQQVHKLSQRLTPVQANYAMVYGQPSLADCLEQLRSRGITRAVILPLYPQYCSATTGSVIDQLAVLQPLYAHDLQWRLVEGYHNHPLYIHALAESLRLFWAVQGRPEKVLFSFHGIPQKLADSGDPYYHQCQETAGLVADALQLAEDEWQVCFQSRFGKAEWVKPYTDVVLAALPAKGIRRVDVITPAFANDCLETLEEISIQAEALFKAAGGERLRHVPCLNDNDAHIDLMVALFAS